VSWTYPAAEVLAPKKQRARADVTTGAAVDAGISIEQLKFPTLMRSDVAIGSYIGVKTQDCACRSTDDPKGTRALKTHLFLGIYGVTRMAPLKLTRAAHRITISGACRHRHKAD
jgi:hypothetical protein